MPTFMGLSTWHLGLVQRVSGHRCSMHIWDLLSFFLEVGPLTAGQVNRECANSLQFRHSFSATSDLRPLEIGVVDHLLRRCGADVLCFGIVRGIHWRETLVDEVL